MKAFFRVSNYLTVNVWKLRVDGNEKVSVPVNFTLTTSNPGWEGVPTCSFLASNTSRFASVLLQIKP